MNDTQELDQMAKDLDFGNEELEIVQESYVALEKSYDILHKAKNPSHQAIQLHRIHVQSLADRLGVRMNTVAVEQFSPRTMHAFALEESQGFFAKIGKAIAAIFKWIKDKATAFFNWITGRTTKEETEATVKVIKEAMALLVDGEIKPEKDNALLQIVVKGKNGSQNTETKTLPFFSEITREYVQDVEPFIDAFFTIYNTSVDLIERMARRTHPESSLKEKFNGKRLSGDNEYDDDVYMRHSIYYSSWILMDDFFKTVDTAHFTKYHKVDYVSLSGDSTPFDRQPDDFQLSKLHASISTNEHFQKSASQIGKSVKLDKNVLEKYGKMYAEFMEDVGNDIKKHHKTFISKVNEFGKEIEGFIKAEEGESEISKKYNREAITVYRKMIGFANGLTSELISFFAKIMRLHNYVEKICKHIIDVSNAGPQAVV